MVCSTAAFAALLLARLASCQECGGRASPIETLHLREWNLSSGVELLHMLEGHWYVVSSINWFEKGWSCFEGDFKRVANGSQVTCSWSFTVPFVGRQRMTDQLSYPNATKVDSLSLRSLSMPEWLRKLLDEEQRGVRVIAVSPPPRPLEWAVLFDCANWVTPTGELFVLSRTPILPDDHLESVRRVVRDNSISDFRILPCSGSGLLVV
mmetsp:Transcript_81299/g.161374  ORF Transcript_81299/g.161374 Transcript_81299/m.161374 type:complete len:208 (-) Transcript_81299:104-727(-)